MKSMPDISGVSFIDSTLVYFNVHYALMMSKTLSAEFTTKASQEQKVYIKGYVFLKSFPVLSLKIYHCWLIEYTFYISHAQPSSFY